MIRKVQLSDANEIVKIYNFYILNSNITFEEEELSIEEMEERIKNKIDNNNPWIVYEEDGVILGYAYLGIWRDRPAYRFSRESSIYLKQDALSNGIGTKLYVELIRLAKEQGIHTIIASITAPNYASFRLHEKLGFKKMTEYKEVGFKNNQWLDVAFYQLML